MYQRLTVSPSFITFVWIEHLSGKTFFIKSIRPETNSVADLF